MKSAFIASGAALLFALAGCASSERTPAVADVAVTNAAVANAASSGAAELAPAELMAAQEKANAANRALANKDYTLARELAMQAQADAKLAQSRASSVKAQTAANTLAEDIRILREELDRNNISQR